MSLVRRITDENLEILSGFLRYLNVKIGAFFRWLYYYLSRGKAPERRQAIRLGRMKTVAERIAYIHGELQRLEWHTSKVKKYIREIDFEAGTRSILREMLHQYRVGVSTKVLVELKKAETSMFRSVCEAIERELPERAEVWIPRIRETIEEVEELVRELEKVRWEQWKIQVVWYSGKPSYRNKREVVLYVWREVDNPLTDEEMREIVDRFFDTQFQADYSRGLRETWHDYDEWFETVTGAETSEDMSGAPIEFYYYYNGELQMSGEMW